MKSTKNFINQCVHRNVEANIATKDDREEREMLMYKYNSRWDLV